MHYSNTVHVTGSEELINAFEKAAAKAGRPISDTFNKVPRQDGSVLGYYIDGSQGAYRDTFGISYPIYNLPYDWTKALAEIQAQVVNLEEELAKYNIKVGQTRCSGKSLPVYERGVGKTDRVGTWTNWIINEAIIQQGELLLRVDSNGSNLFYSAVDIGAFITSEIVIGDYAVTLDSSRGRIEFGCQSFNKTELYAIQRLVKSPIYANIIIQGVKITDDMLEKLIRMIENL